jgi:hypothetical protein
MGSSLIGLLIGAAVKLILGYISDRKAEATLKEAGAAETATKISQENADADRRATQVVVNAKRGADVDDDLANGTRGF